jgi:Arc/MetJ-type ribon-helix-helix transcriptional regulator
MRVEVSEPGIEQYIEQRVRAGDFPSAAAMLQEAVARMMRHEQEDQEVLTPEDIAAIAEAEAEFERGEYEEFAVVAARLRDKFGAS